MITRWLIGLLASTALVLPAIGAENGAEEQLRQMEKRMQTLQQQMDQIHAAKDAKERDRLLDEHIQTMQEQMREMRGMGGDMMMGMPGGGRAGGGMRDRQQMMSPDTRDKMMQNRMDMMQMMMEQMMNELQILQGKVHGRMHGQ